MREVIYAFRVDLPCPSLNKFENIQPDRAQGDENATQGQKSDLTQTRSS